MVMIGGILDEEPDGGMFEDDPEDGDGDGGILDEEPDGGMFEDDPEGGDGGIVDDEPVGEDCGVDDIDPDLLVDEGAAELGDTLDPDDDDILVILFDGEDTGNEVSVTR